MTEYIYYEIFSKNGFVQKISIYFQPFFINEAPLLYCWGFIDGKIRRICRPGVNHKVMYNGHKKVHAMKFQSVAGLNSLVANVFWTVQNKRHNAKMPGGSKLSILLQVQSKGPDDTFLCIYGNPAYLHRLELITPFRGAIVSERYQTWNASMSAVTTAVDIVNYYSFLYLDRKIKIQLVAVGNIDIICLFVQNAISGVYGSLTAYFF